MFNIVHDQICWEGVEEPFKSKEDWGTLDLLEQYWDRGTYGEVDRSWWDGDKRRAFWDNGKAKRLLGWESRVG